MVVRLEREKSQEEERQAVVEGKLKGIPRLAKMLVHKQEKERLNSLWSKAAHHAGIAPHVAPHVFEDDYVRQCHAIYETSKVVVT
jgi:hypothetical protein